MANASEGSAYLIPESLAAKQRQRQNDEQTKQNNEINK